MADNAEQLTPPAPPSPFRAALEAAKHIRLPDRVRQAYEWNELKDVFLERTPGGQYPPKLGGGAFRRMWFAGTDSARQNLPAVPEEYPRIPNEFCHPNTRKRLTDRQHAEGRRVWESERAEQDTRPVLVP